MISIEHENGFFVRSDGSFRACFGGIESDLLKAVQKNNTVVYPFQGICSTPDKDLEGEALLQKGLNFTPFMEHGEFNWNHIPFAMVGVPAGKKAWFEDPVWKSQGEIIGGLTVLEQNGVKYTSDQIVQQHNALRKSGHTMGLCQSVEGKVVKRSDCGKFVKKADIYHIALTFHPINQGTSVDLLAKSLAGRVEILTGDRFYDSVEKGAALAVSNAKPFMQEDLEGAAVNEKDNVGKLASRLRDRLMLKKGMSRIEAEVRVWDFLRSKFG